MKRNLISELQQRSQWTFLKNRAPRVAARFPAANERSPPRGPPTAASPALWGAAPPPSAPAWPRAALPTAATRNRAGQAPWLPIRSNGHSMRPDQRLAACSRPQTTDVDVLPSDTSWLFEPTTGVHQFGGGSVELVLDAPMAAGDMEQPLGRDVFGQEIVTHDGRIGTLTPQASARGDASHRSGAWKAVEASRAGIAHDGGASHFAPIVGRAVDLLGCAALARSRKLLGNRGEQAAAVGLDRQNIVAAALAHRSRKRAGTMQRIGGNDAAFQRQKLQHLQSACRLVATSCLLLGQGHAGIHRKDVDQMQRSSLCAAFVGPT